MSKVLFVQFADAESAAGASFADALGLPFDVITVAASAPPADALAKAIAAACEGYSHIASVSSMMSKDVMARVAGLLDASMVTDALSIVDAKTFVRPMVAGAVLATVEVLAEPVVVTFRPAGFAAGAATAQSQQALGDLPATKTARIDVASRVSARPDLTQAKVIVSGGRPLGDSATFERVIGGLADKLGGAVGATRAAVDSGIAPNELQVGQTGKIVAPDLYIAAGISGSTQHMAGIKDSKVIVAINKDPDAPIFEVADFGLVADLFDAVPEMTSKV